MHTAQAPSGELRGQAIFGSNVGVAMLNGANSVPTAVSAAQGTAIVLFVDNGQSLWFGATEATYEGRNEGRNGGKGYEGGGE